MNSKNKIKYFSFLFLCAGTLTVFAQNSKFKVTLDAGHGGKDFGAVYNGHIEKNVALAVTLKVGKILEGNPSIAVNYTRKTDVFIDLIERANIANRADANIFVSMHCNANKNTMADGTETYVMGMSKNASNLAVAKSENEVITMEKDYKEKYEGFDPGSPESMIGITITQEEYMENSIALASKIQNRFIDGLGKKSRGVKQAPYMVLHKAYMPRVLIEMGFISNPKEGAALDSEEGQQELAKAIADAIVSYKKEYYGSGAGDTEDKPSEKIEKTAAQDDTPSKPEIAEKAAAALPNPEAPKAEAPKIGVIFKVQISASGKKLEPTPSNFKGLKNISIIAENGSLYKYMYGETPSYDTAKQNLSEARSKGFDTAYLVAFKDGKKISIQEAIK